MVTRRFKKGSVYEILANKSGLDFAPYLHHHRTCHTQDRSLPLLIKFSNSNGDLPRISESFNSKTMIPESGNTSQNFEKSRKFIRNSSPENSKKDFSGNREESNGNSPKHSANHEKYPSWPVTTSPTDFSETIVTHRSQSWTSKTDYPKEKAVLTRPKKLYKISPHQLQPVLEKPSDSNRCKNPNIGKSNVTEPKQIGELTAKELKDNIYASQTSLPKNFKLSTPPERDTYKNADEDMLNRLDDFTKTFPSLTSSLASEQRYYSLAQASKSFASLPFCERGSLDKIHYSSSKWQSDSSASGEFNSADDVNDEWKGSSSDLSSFSVQVSNRSSLFDSGLSTMPDSGRLSPQSLYGGSTNDTCTRTHLISRHGFQRGSVARSSKVQPPQRHDSESVVYYDIKLQDSPLKEPFQKSSPLRKSLMDIPKKQFVQAEKELKYYPNNTSPTSKDKKLTIPPISNDSYRLDNSDKKSSENQTKKPNQKLAYLDPEKKLQIPNPHLKFIQKKAVLTFYEKHKKQQQLQPAERGPDQIPRRTSFSSCMGGPLVRAPSIQRSRTSWPAVLPLADDIPPQVPPKNFGPEDIPLLEHLDATKGGNAVATQCSAPEVSSSPSGTTAEVTTKPLHSGVRVVIAAPGPPPPPPKRARPPQRPPPPLPPNPSPPAAKPDPVCTISTDHNAWAIMAHRKPRGNSQQRRGSSPTTAWERRHNIRQPAPTVIFHSDSLKSNGHNSGTLLRELLDQCAGDSTLFHSLFVPRENQKTLADFMTGLVDQEDTSQPSSRNSSPSTSPGAVDSRIEDENAIESKKGQEDLLRRLEEEQQGLESDRDAVLLQLRAAESRGEGLEQRLDQLAGPAECERLHQHLQEAERIVSLLLSVTARLARAHNALAALEPAAPYRKILEAKKDKLSEQHIDARRLKDSIDKRGVQIAAMLNKHFNEEEMQAYHQFLKSKSRLQVEAREVEEKIKLGEEQITALRTCINLQLWKNSYNS